MARSQASVARVRAACASSSRWSAASARAALLASPDPGGAVASGRRFGAGLGVAHRSGKSRMTGAR
jgi:hypothetical protein